MNKLMTQLTSVQLIEAAVWREHGSTEPQPADVLHQALADAVSRRYLLDLKAQGIKRKLSRSGKKDGSRNQKTHKRASLRSDIFESMARPGELSEQCFSSSALLLPAGKTRSCAGLEPSSSVEQRCLMG
jgi:hypothetical protein